MLDKLNQMTPHQNLMSLVNQLGLDENRLVILDKATLGNKQIKLTVLTFEMAKTNPEIHHRILQAAQMGVLAGIGKLGNGLVLRMHTDKIREFQQIRSRPTPVNANPVNESDKQSSLHMRQADDATFDIDLAEIDFESISLEDYLKVQELVETLLANIEAENEPEKTKKEERIAKHATESSHQTLLNPQPWKPLAGRHKHVTQVEKQQIKLQHEKLAVTQQQHKKAGELRLATEKETKHKKLKHKILVEEINKEDIKHTRKKQEPQI